MKYLGEKSEEQQMIVKTVEDIVGEYDHEYWFEHVSNEEFPQEFWDSLVEHGFVGINIPEEYGGTEMGLPAMASAYREMGKRGVEMSLLVTNSTMIAISINEHGNDDVRERFLPDIADGETIFCVAITESHAGSNTFKITTEAKRDGDEYVVNGQKVFISGVEIADYLFLMARTTPYEEVVDDDRKQGGTILAVDTDADGVTAKKQDMDMYEAVGQYEVFFDDVRVPVENRVGPEGDGFPILFNALNDERIITAALCSGLGHFCLDSGAEYAKDRDVFDAPIGSHQAIQHPLAEAKIELEMADLALEEAAEIVENRGDDAGAYANIANYKAADGANRAVDAAIQTLGGNAWSTDYGVITMRDRIRHYRLAPISDEMVLNYVGQRLLEMPRSY